MIKEDLARDCHRPTRVECVDNKLSRSELGAWPRDLRGEPCGGEGAGEASDVGKCSPIGEAAGGARMGKCSPTGGGGGASAGAARGRCSSVGEASGGAAMGKCPPIGEAAGASSVGEKGSRKFCEQTPTRRT